MKVIVTVEVEVAVDVPTRNADLAVRSVRENWDANWKHYVKEPWSHAALHGRALLFRAEGEDDGER